MAGGLIKLQERMDGGVEYVCYRSESDHVISDASLANAVEGVNKFTGVSSKCIVSTCDDSH